MWEGKYMIESEEDYDNDVPPLKLGLSFFFYA